MSPVYESDCNSFPVHSNLYIEPEKQLEQCSSRGNWCGSKTPGPLPTFFFFFWFGFVCSSSQTIQLFWVSIIIYWTRDLFYLLTQFGNHALVAASPTWLDAFWSRYVVQVDNVTFFFVMSLTTSQNITRALNCDSGIVATVASVQRTHVTRIVVGCNVSYFS